MYILRNCACMYVKVKAAILEIQLNIDDEEGKRFYVRGRTRTSCTPNREALIRLILIITLSLATILHKIRG